MDDVKDNYSQTLNRGSEPEQPDSLADIDKTLPSRGKTAPGRDKTVQSTKSFGVGTKLKDRYLLEREIGQGGFGTVYLARDEELLSKRVVVKVLLQEFIQDAWFKKKFQQEKEALARIDHPGVVGVLDSGKTPGGNQFLVMQFVEGQTLTSLIKPEGMDLDKIAQIMQQMGRALTAAHNEGIIHCDLKPENVMVQNSDEDDLLIKIIDFGVAKVRDSQVAKSGDVTRVAGTLYYLAPEQIDGRPSASSDIYSMGVIAYILATGRRPFNPRNGPLHITTNELIEMQRSNLKFNPKDLRPDLPESAQRAIVKALSFDPNDRYSRARDFGDALAAALTAEPDEEPVEGRRAGAATDQRPAPETAHVLIIEIAGHSDMLTEQQNSATKHLQEFTRTASQFQRTRADKGVVSVPTANGVALVFDDPIAAVKCAEEVTQSFKGNSTVAVRMGLHTGRVYGDRDTNASLNLTGGVIDVAQKVMDCGDPGHILVSKAMADVLKQLHGYAGLANDLGEFEVKEGDRVHLYNLHHGEIGNPVVPNKLKKGAARSRKRAIAMGVAAILVLIVIAVVFQWRTSTQSHTAAEIQLPELALGISLEAQKPAGPLVPLFDKIAADGEINFKFDVGDGLRWRVGTEQPGYLYIMGDAAVGDVTVLFPTPGSNGGSASLEARKEIPLPPTGWFKCKQTGYERFWVAWAAQPIGVLEDLIQSGKRTANSIAYDPRQVDKAREFLTKQSATRPQTTLDAEKTQLKLKIKGEVLAVSLVKR